ncbi:MAG: hypothetical protein OXG15_12530 [Gammaproteobacteria bacterium]|nr:hypothetical protein [Gammaproteobacteria bacterium]
MPDFDSVPDIEFNILAREFDDKDRRFISVSSWEIQSSPHATLSFLLEFDTGGSPSYTMSFPLTITSAMHLSNALRAEVNARLEIDKDSETE